MADWQHRLGIRSITWVKSLHYLDLAFRLEGGLLVSAGGGAESGYSRFHTHCPESLSQTQVDVDV